jgi:predicted enzyme related to lactoylglutathione lyase
MGERESYAAGTFCWADLGTTDAAAAREFYTGLLGWEALDVPAQDDGGVYVMFQLEGRDVAALYEMGEEERERLAPHWSSYVSVEDVDAVAERARELGAMVLAEPFDVMDSGRMAVVRDPTGALVHLWQPAGHTGAGRVNEPGCMAWNELATPDVERARRFYRALLGWDAEKDPTGYATVRNGEALNGGMRPLRDGETPGWLIYFTVASLDEAVEHVRTGGGEIVVEPADGPAGRIAVVRDPQGALLALFEGDVDP